MKPQQINNLYSKLTPHEQANLAFAAAIRHDETEVDLILNAVEKKTYITTHVDYHTRTHGLVQLSGVFGTFYWKTFFKLSTVNLSKTGEAFDKVAQKHINEFIALNIALDNVCQLLNIDDEIIRIYAQCRGINPDFKGVADDTLITQYTEAFTISAKLSPS